MKSKAHSPPPSSPKRGEATLTADSPRRSRIRITFSCDDLNNAPDEDDASLTDTAMQDADLEPDPADLPTDTQSGGANTKGSVNQGRTASGNLRVAPEDNVAPSDRESASEEESDDQEDQEQERNFPARLFITIERPKKGALQVEAVAQDGVIGIDNVYYYKDAKLVDPATQEDEANAARAYTGPPFGNLDEDLQVLFEKYLDERGINTTMALFVPEYIDYKELREYLGWMKSKSRSYSGVEMVLTCEQMSRTLWSNGRCGGCA